MTPRGKKYLLKPLVFLIAAIALEGCISPVADNAGRYTAPIGGSPVISNETPYSAALRCMAHYTAQHPIRIAVGQIADYTGKSESDNSGRKITQGAALMAMSALSKAGVQLVERFDTSVAEMELKYANNKLIGADATDGPAGPDYRQIIAGSIPGSDYYLVGGITELNFNIRSEGASADGGETASNGVKGQMGGNMYVMNVGLDLRLVDTKTLQVVDVISYQKQIIGHQVSVGVFDFLGANFFDASVGQSALEPIQLAVRSVIERATLEMTSRLYHTEGGCSASSDPLADATDTHVPLAVHANAPVTAHNTATAAPAAIVEDRPATPYASADTAATAPAAVVNDPPAPVHKPRTSRNEEHHNDDASRQDPYRYYGSSDPTGDTGLRGSE